MYVVVGVVVGILVVLLSIVAYLFYRGYGKIKGKALNGESEVQDGRFDMYFGLFFLHGLDKF